MDREEGYAVVTSPDEFGRPRKFKGYYKAGLRCGQGVLEIYAPDNQPLRFEGAWLNDRLNGPGRMIHPTHILSGVFVNSFLEGQGTMEDRNTGVTYTVFFQNGNILSGYPVMKNGLMITGMGPAVVTGW